MIERASDEACELERGFPSRMALERERLAVAYAAPLIHEQRRERDRGWLSEHRRKNGEPHPQDVPYEELPEQENEKDRAVARAALDAAGVGGVRAAAGDPATAERLAHTAASDLHDACRSSRRLGA